jgi:hypothetical protein
MANKSITFGEMDPNSNSAHKLLVIWPETVYLFSSEKWEE